MQRPEHVGVHGSTYTRTTIVEDIALDIRLRPVESETYTLDRLVDRDDGTGSPEWRDWLSRQRSKRLEQAMHPCPRCGVRPTIDDPCSECTERTELGLPIPA